MQPITLLVLAVVCTVALADGQYYVPRSYYVIDSAGHESVPVPLRRLRRSLRPENARLTASSSWSSLNHGDGWYRPPADVGVPQHHK